MASQNVLGVAEQISVYGIFSEFSLILSFSLTDLTCWVADAWSDPDSAEAGETQDRLGTPNFLVLLNELCVLYLSPHGFQHESEKKPIFFIKAIYMGRFVVFFCEMIIEIKVIKLI